MLLSNFLFSGFCFLPLCFLLVLGVMWSLKKNMLTLPDTTLLLSMFMVFGFNNAAPPYDGWQMRGAWIARLYQPIFVVLAAAIARGCQHLGNISGAHIRKVVVVCGLVITIIGNGLVAFGPIMNDPWRLSAELYWRFYQHSPVESMQINLARYGRRPLGFCQ